MTLRLCQSASTTVMLASKSHEHEHSWFTTTSLCFAHRLWVGLLTAQCSPQTSRAQETKPNLTSQCSGHIHGQVIGQSKSCDQATQTAVGKQSHVTGDVATGSLCWEWRIETMIQPQLLCNRHRKCLSSGLVWVTPYGCQIPQFLKLFSRHYPIFFIFPTIL